MIKLHYEVETGNVINAYDVDSCENIPTPNIEVSEAEWTAAAGKTATVENGVLVLTEKPAPVVVVRYSKLLIIRALKSAGIWTSVKAAIVDADAQDEWDAAAWLASDDTLFVSLKNQLAESYPNVNLVELLEQCKY